MNKRIKFFLLLTFLTTFSACFRGNVQDYQNVGTRIATKYATLLKINEVDGKRIATILNPWDTTKVLQRYVIKSPIKNALVTTSLHTILMKNLNAEGSIGGLCDAEYVVDSSLQALVSAGKILNCGSTMSPNKEAILAMQPDAVFLSPYEGADYSFYTESGLNVIECVDYLEPSPLAQAEWMRFYGMILGREREADSIFAMVESNYLNLRDSVKNVASRPRMIAELLTGQVWYTPTGHSTTGTIYQDAGAEYIFADISDDKAVMPLSFEQVLAKGHDADFWFFKYYSPQDFTYESLINDYELYGEFKAFKDKSIWACNTSYVPYYDVVPFRPDILLRDMVAILHPEILPEYQPRFFTRMK